MGMPFAHDGPAEAAAAEALHCLVRKLLPNQTAWEHPRPICHIALEHSVTSCQQYSSCITKCGVTTEAGLLVSCKKAVQELTTESMLQRLFLKAACESQKETLVAHQTGACAHAKCG